MDFKNLISKVLGASLGEAPKAKNNKGISLMALIITIIVLIIIASIVLSTFNATTQEKATSAKVLNEFIEVENAVSQRGNEHKLDGAVYPYEGKALSSLNGITVNNKFYGEGFYLLEEEDLMKLNITGTVKNYIVNYETGEVIATEAYMVGSRLIYTRAELVEEETDNSISGLAEYDEEKGVNKPVLFHGMIPVKLVGGQWQVTSIDDKEWYDYAVSGTGPIRYANVMLLDDIELSDGDTTIRNEKVRTMNIDSMVGKNVIKEGSMFIWIPRYTYKGNEVVYSKLTVDYTQNGFVKNPAFYNGQYTGATTENNNTGYVAGGKELTGIWISKYEASYMN